MFAWFRPVMCCRAVLPAKHACHDFAPALSAFLSMPGNQMPRSVRPPVRWSNVPTARFAIRCAVARPASSRMPASTRMQPQAKMSRPTYACSRRAYRLCVLQEPGRCHTLAPARPASPWTQAPMPTSRPAPVLMNAAAFSPKVVPSSPNPVIALIPSAARTGPASAGAGSSSDALPWDWAHAWPRRRASPDCARPCPVPCSTTSARGLTARVSPNVSTRSLPVASSPVLSA
jgi:hypothetical protein